MHSKHLICFNLPLLPDDATVLSVKGESGQCVGSSGEKHVDDRKNQECDTAWWDSIGNNLLIGKVEYIANEQGGSHSDHGVNTPGRDNSAGRGSRNGALPRETSISYVKRKNRVSSRTLAEWLGKDQALGFAENLERLEMR